MLGRAERPSRGSGMRADIQVVRIRPQHLVELRHGSLRGVRVGERLAQAVGRPDRLAAQCERVPEMLEGSAKRLCAHEGRSRASSGRGPMLGCVAESIRSALLKLPIGCRTAARRTRPKLASPGHLTSLRAFEMASISGSKASWPPNAMPMGVYARACSGPIRRVHWRASMADSHGMHWRSRSPHWQFSADLAC